MAPVDYSDEEVDDETDVEEVEEEVEEESDEEVPAKKKRGRGAAKKAKDPNKPKRALSAFFMYSQANRPRVKEEFPESSFGEVARILAREYKELSAKDKSKWEKKSAQDKLRYEEEMKYYEPSEEYVTTKSKRSKKDPNAPKRNMSAYFLYSIDNRARIKSENPSISFGDIARMISEQYKALSPDERKVYDEKAIADKARYEQEMKIYKDK